MVSEFIRRSHYNESVSVLSHYFSAKDINKAMSRGHSVEPEVYLEDNLIDFGNSYLS